MIDKILIYPYALPLAIKIFIFLIDKFKIILLITILKRICEILILYIWFL
jgi:hypothetical protein